MSSAAAAGIRAFGIDRGLPFPLADLGRADTLLLVGANPAETMPPLVRYLTEQRERRRHADRHRPPGHRRPPARPTCTCNHCPAPTWRWPTRCCTSPSPRAGSTGRTSPTAPPGSTRSARRRRRVLAGAGRSSSPGCRWPTWRRPPGRWAPRGRAIILTARGAEQHAKGVDTVTAYDQPRPRARPARPRRLRVRLPHRPGQRPGRAGARAEGRPAPRLPEDRRPGGPGARGRGVGRRPRRACPARACPPYELLDSLGTPDGPQALLVFGSNPVVSAPRAARIEGRLRDLDLLVVADFVLSETAALADVVLPTAQWAEEDGTMTNLEGRVLRRRALRPPPPGVRTDLAVIADLAAGWPSRRDASPTPAGQRATGRRRGAGSRPTRPPSSTSCAGPPPVGPPTTPASAGTGSTPRTASSGPARPRTGRARPDCSPTGSPPRTAGPGSSRSSTGRPPRRSAPTYPLLPHHRPGAGAVPVRRPDPTGRPRCARAAPEAFVELHPDLAARLGIDDGDPVRVTTPPGRDRALRPGSRRRSGPTRSSPRSTGRGRAGPTRSPTTRWTRSRGCPSSRSARSGWRRHDRAGGHRRQRHGRRAPRRSSCTPGTRRDRKVTVLGAEPHRAYNRILLSNLLAGRIDETGRGADRGRRARRRPAQRRTGDRHRPGRPARSRTDRRRTHRVRPPGAGHRRPCGGAAAARPRPGEPAGAGGRLPDPGRLPADPRRRRRRPHARWCSAAGCSAWRRPAGWPPAGWPSPCVHPVGHLMERQLDPAAGAVLAGTLAGLRRHRPAGGAGDRRGRGRRRRPPRRWPTAGDSRADLLVLACGVRPDDRPRRRPPA